MNLGAALLIAFVVSSETGWLQQDGRGEISEKPVAGLYDTADGKLGVQSLNPITLKDKSRNKDLHLKVSFPKSDGVFPIIVWSHGMYGSKNSYTPLVNHWTSHGYVVIQPTHSDSISLMSAEERRSTLKNPKRDKVQDWESRPKDIKFVLDSLDEIAKASPELAKRMNRKVIGVGGHSFGAFTTQLVAGTTL